MKTRQEVLENTPYRALLGMAIHLQQRQYQEHRKRAWINA
jgi:hypothetical protein